MRVGSFISEFSESRNYKALARTIALLAGLLLITGCGDIKFADGSAGSSKLEANSTEVTSDRNQPEQGDNESAQNGDSDRSDDGSIDPDDPIVSPDLPKEEQEQITSNEGCLEILDKATGNSDPRSGRNRNFVGYIDTVFAENVDNINISGRTNAVGILGANTVNINGRSQDLCIVARQINISGAIKNGQNVVLVGETGRSDSFVSSINGSGNVELVVKDMTLMNINGSYSKIILDNATVGQMNGRIREIHIVNGSVIESSAGQIDSIVYH
ncbi:MAG: hypothetical protein HRT45_15705 [Bdellovibrionales bacterium]|nr:hypothetical protein [Bdellovibrionales bacterium]